WRWQRRKVGGHGHNRRAVIFRGISCAHTALRLVVFDREEIYGCQGVRKAELIAEGVSHKLQQGRGICLPAEASAPLTLLRLAYQVGTAVYGVHRWDCASQDHGIR